MVFVEVPKFSKQLEQLETLTDQWIYFLKAAPSLESIPDNTGEVPEIDKVLNIDNQAGLTVQELETSHKQEVFWEDIAIINHL